jgi:hypothetical protein
MNPSDKEALLHRYIDGELDAAQSDAFERLLETDPDLLREVESLRVLAEAVREQFPAEQEPPSPDFFNAHILRQIEHGETGQARGRGQAAGQAARRSVFGRFSLPFVPWAIATASLLAALFLGLHDRGSVGSEGSVALSAAPGHSSVQTTYTPVDGVRADTFFSRDAGATVIRLVGLEEIPSDREIAGHAAVDHRPAEVGDPIELRDGAGRLLLTMGTGADGKYPDFFQSLN